MSQSKAIIVTCDNAQGHNGKPPSVQLDENGLMPKGWRTLVISAADGDNGESYDICSPGCGTDVATNFVRYKLYGMKE